MLAFSRKHEIAAESVDPNRLIRAMDEMLRGSIGPGHDFDVILLDFAMPVMTGAQLAAEVVRFWPDAPIVFMTGYVETDILQPWLEQGYWTVRKPFTSADLAAAIRRATAGRATMGNVVRLRKQ